MALFQIMKPVRGALPSDWGDTSWAIQWSFTFVISTIAVTVYNFLTSRVSLRIMVPGVFVFFGLSFLAIFGAYKSGYSVRFHERKESKFNFFQPILLTSIQSN